jgi:hypothetical protein
MLVSARELLGVFGKKICPCQKCCVEWPCKRVGKKFIFENVIKLHMIKK